MCIPHANGSAVILSIIFFYVCNFVANKRELRKKCTATNVLHRSPVCVCVCVCSIWCARTKRWAMHSNSIRSKLENIILTFFFSSDLLFRFLPLLFDAFSSIHWFHSHVTSTPRPCDVGGITQRSSHKHTHSHFSAHLFQKTIIFDSSDLSQSFPFRLMQIICLPIKILLNLFACDFYFFVRLILYFVALHIYCCRRKNAFIPLLPHSLMA